MLLGLLFLSLYLGYWMSEQHLLSQLPVCTLHQQHPAVKQAEYGRITA